MMRGGSPRRRSKQRAPSGGGVALETERELIFNVVAVSLAEVQDRHAAELEEVEARIRREMKINNRIAALEAKVLGGR
jgi:hypothetical protein